ncbi:polysaccharide pyruvyl transferase family protein [Cryobacterium sp. 1639]|uniref:polysaccharide pyruvyl transferase family protein n=1 Tax=Cryobacterium inferilacus TaxID=2866629 RepID=UPI001C72D805|nr:polysaccharide pyruvyl transferase family protein [Cryobacterium sp. 1639]MBX0301731.1 polysaccharide pyruvyl transferase family protein [Cryobacterium sp. 1639]
MKVTLIHAYSRTNSGDGLLVDEAASLVSDAFPGADITLIALDPQSFADNFSGRVLHPLTGQTESIGSFRTLLRGIESLIRGLQLPASVQGVLSESDLVVAVGGGYLRTKSPIEALKNALTHMPQLPSREDPRYVYLPQSIGPLNFATAGFVRSRLKNAAMVNVRDGRSADSLSGLKNVHRNPDMALLGLPSAFETRPIDEPAGSGRVGLVARDLGRGSRVRKYEAGVLELHERNDLEVLVQANARGNNDPLFYERLGMRGPFRTLKDATAQESFRPSVVISVRLHGAIQSIRSRVPSVHLSYERKGWGAYEDLGLSPYVHNAFDFDPAKVEAQVGELAADPTSYWEAVDRSVTELSSARQGLVARLQLAGSPETVM